MTPAARDAKSERKPPREDPPFPWRGGQEVGHVEISLYGRTVRVSLHQVRELTKTQRAMIDGKSLGLMGPDAAYREARKLIGRTAGTRNLQ